VIDLHDSEILAIEKGPMAWMEQNQGSYRDLEDFRRAAIDKFGEIGFQVRLKCYDTNQAGCYAFDVEIYGRVPGSQKFDPDRQVHEVTHNILDLPDQEKGFIKTDKKMFEDLAAGNVSAGQKHRH
jgi:hypothetical protein